MRRRPDLNPTTHHALPKKMPTAQQQANVARALGTIIAACQEIQWNLPKRSVDATRVRLRTLLTDAGYALEQLHD